MKENNKQLQVTTLKTSDLKPYENNPRLNDSAVEAVAKSIKEFGFRQAIVIDETNTIVCGHTRWKAAKKLGIETVPCFVVNDLTEEQIKAYRLADNKTAELAEWDFDLLEIEMDSIDTIDMDLFGFACDVVDTAEAVEDEYEVQLHEDTKTKSGQLWKLGNHRLYVGDSTNSEDVNTLCDGELMDLVVTDPPYNVAIENSQGMTIENDNMDTDSFRKFLVSAFENMKEHLKAGGAFYIWYASREAINFETALNEVGLQVREQLIWNKNTFNLGRQDYQWKHEPCLYGWAEGASHYFIDDRTLSTVLDEPKPKKNDLHPTMKPIKLIARQVKNSSKPTEKVLDLFGGSGSTLIACEQLNRVCYMMEYDPQYADAILDRWEKLTGKEAVLMNG